MEQRQSGRTSRQMLEALPNSVFIWCNGFTDYPRRLAHDLGRSDLQIVTPGWIEARSWRGVALPEIIVDHATELTNCQEMLLDQIWELKHACNQ